MRGFADPGRSGGPSIAHSPVAAQARRTRRRADALLAGDPTANILDLDNLLTDACASVLELRRRHRRVERELSALIDEEADAPRSVARVTALTRESRDVHRQLVRMQELIGELTPHRRAWESAGRP
jgi:hypothetical protein